MKRHAAVEWLRSVADRWGDVALALALTAFIQVDIWTGGGYLTGSKPFFSFASLLMTAPLAWRRRFPLAVTLVVGCAILLQVALEDGPHPRTLRSSRGS